MSVKAMGRVWDTELAPNHKLVLLAYADAAEHDGTQSFPGWERLVEMTGYSRSQIDRITGELIELGALERVRAGRRGQRAEFAVLVTPNAAQSEGDSDASEPVSDAQLRDTSRPNSRPTHPTDVSTELFEVFWEFWTGKEYSPTVRVTGLQRGRINAAVKAAIADDLDPDEVRLRGKRYRDEWPDMEPSPQALLAHWERFADVEPRPPCDECDDRGVVYVNDNGEREPYDSLDASTAVNCPSCKGPT